MFVIRQKIVVSAVWTFAVCLHCVDPFVGILLYFFL